MTCPECGGESRVTDTRSDKEGVYRRRKCKVCNRNFFTVEAVSSPNKFRNATNWYINRRKLNDLNREN